MSVEYDLIILGATPAGIHAAIAAANLKARVALVTQGISAQTATEETYQQSLVEVAQTVDRMRYYQASGWWEASSVASSPVRWEAIHSWSHAVAANLDALRSPAALAYHGVDVIQGMGEFCRKPAPGVVTEGRFIQARAYLLAMGCQTAPPDIDGLEATGYLTRETLQQGWNLLAQDASSERHWVIVGSGKTAVELAHSLTQLGVSLTLIVHQSSFLPDVDREAAQWIKAQLEGEGVRLLTNVSIDFVRSHAGQKVLQIGQQTIQADEIIVATGDRPNVAALNLDAMGVRWSERGIWHKDTLQTTNPKIYTCEGRIGTECFTQVAIHQAAIALKNIVFFPWFKPNYRTIPLVVRSPEFASVGQTEAQANKHFGRKVIVLQRSFKNLPKAQYRNDLTGVCKLIVHQNGTLLGAHVFGSQSSEIINIFALAMQQRLKINALAGLVPPSSTVAEIIYQMAQDYSQVRLKQNPSRQDLLDHWFDLRRAWSKG